MVDKDFEKITYEDNSGNVKGTFETFQFASTGPSAPFNEGYGQNLSVTRETKKDKVPNMGFRHPLKIEQYKESGDAWVKIAFTTPQTRKDQYGMLFAMRFLNNTKNAIASYSAYTSAGGVDTGQPIKTLGRLTVNGKNYEYFLAKVAPDSQNRTSTTVQFNFYAGLLTSGKMSIEIYEGFTFNNLSDGDYTRANVTTRTPYPHQKDFDKHKFQDVMSGDVLLVGTKQNDGTVTANGLLRLNGLNLRGAIPFQTTVLLPYKGLATNTWSVALTGIDAGYPSPIFPCYGTGQITIRLLTHYFDDDAAIPTSNFTLQYRLIAYKETGSASLSRDFHLHTNINYTNEDGVKPVIKRSGDVFLVNRELTYNPPSDCIGYSLELKQVKPTTGLGNESLLVCLLTQDL